MKPLRLFQGIVCTILLCSTAATQAAAPAAPDYVKLAWIKNLEEFLVRWLPVPGATSYNVYYYEPTPATWAWVGRNLSFDPWNVPSFRMHFPGAGPGTFAVTAVNADGESAMVSASVTPGEGLIGSFTTGDEWWPKGYTFVDPSFMYDRIDEPIDGMVELGLSATNFTHAAWHTNFDLGHQLHITNLSPGTVWVTRMTMVNSNGIGVSYLYPYYGTYTLPLPTIDVWEDTENTIEVGHYTWPAPAQLFSPPLHGAVTPGSYWYDWKYTPEPNFTGTDAFEILDNPDGPPVTITVNVQNINDPPIANEFTVYVPEDAQSVFTPPVTDIDSSFYVTMVYNPPVYGWATGWESTNLLYEPPLNFVGTDEFTYIAADYEWSLPARVVVIVTNVNDAPVADAKSISVDEDQSLAVALTGSDVDGDTLTFSVVTPPQHGQFVDGIYSPAANYHGPDNFTYKANDGQADSALATVSITVSAVNDAPVANNQSVSTPYNTAVNITLTGSDVEGSALTFTTLSSPANGTLTGTGADRAFTPNIGWSGVTSFTFRVNDGALDSATATVTITVAGPGSVPAAPSALTAIAVSRTQINLTWTDNSNNEDGFKIERSSNGSSGWTQIATVGPNVAAYSNTGLSKNTRYYYRVRAYNVLGNSGYSNTANARTLN